MPMTSLCYLLCPPQVLELHACAESLIHVLKRVGELNASKTKTMIVARVRTMHSQ